MSIWKEIKKALNSSLGTENFMPLDERIAYQKALQSSDDVYLNPIDNSAFKFSETLETPVMQFLCPGTTKLRVASGNVSNTYGLQVYFYKNGKLIDVNGNETTNFGLLYSDINNGQDDSNRYFVETNSLTFEPGDKFQVKLIQRYSGSGTANSTHSCTVTVSVFGTLVDNVIRLS